MTPWYWLIFAFAAGWAAHIVRMHFWFKEYLNTTLDHIEATLERPEGKP